MEPFTVHTGVAAPMLRINIDTDAIIPSREMKGVSKKGLGDGLFAVWRYTNPDERTINPDFVLNRPAYRNTTILLGGDNFGCGSSREHAVWALAEYGIRAVIAPGFGSIFYQNCIRNGILPVVLSDAAIAVLANSLEQDPQGTPLTIDLNQQLVIDGGGQRYPFEIAPGHREMLLKGLDAIGLTLQLDEQIGAFENRYRQQFPWLYESA
ncbi:3-isopropylmalate dehydratase small subunit [Halioxenophilus sp. WMMB6]|uniref:3-isopropylmalate dehydratase small subunit n=1 Tax=Halioxenophilus sp. WMMB6 TaxID=3073815 RepID=UPI00295ECBC0|nr:3-isopropylmalate dehydratase small subunit [Halioxenophilus sp. WMMB6]